MNCREKRYGEKGVFMDEPIFAHQILCKNNLLDVISIDTGSARDGSSEVNVNDNESQCCGRVY